MTTAARPPREFYLTRGNDIGPEELTHICLFDFHADKNPLILVERSAYDQLAKELAEAKAEIERLKIDCDSWRNAHKISADAGKIR